MMPKITIDVAELKNKTECSINKEGNEYLE
jgi:hypothetical protein